MQQWRLTAFPWNKISCIRVQYVVGGARRTAEKWTPVTNETTDEHGFVVVAQEIVSFSTVTEITVAAVASKYNRSTVVTGMINYCYGLLLLFIIAVNWFFFAMPPKIDTKVLHFNSIAFLTISFLGYTIFDAIQNESFVFTPWLSLITNWYLLSTYYPHE